MNTPYNRGSNQRIAARYKLACIDNITHELSRIPHKMPMFEDSQTDASDVYDCIAAEYAADVDENPYNEYWEGPATKSLVPSVEDKRILDAGCGTGAYTEWLRHEGADVVAVDASEEMLGYARDRVGDSVEFHVVDLSNTLPFPDCSFDGIMSPLVLGHLAELRPPMMEFGRICTQDGFLVCSLTHPLADFCAAPHASYFETQEMVLDEWSEPVPYYRRPLEEVLNPLIEAGFVLEEVVEPRPPKELQDARPAEFSAKADRPSFLCFRARKPAEDGGR